MKSIACVPLAALFFSASVFAGELVYAPVNPSFGGSPLNGSFLLNSAQSQDKHTDTSQSSGASSQQLSPLQQFQKQLQSAILNRIAAAVSGSIVGTNGQLQPGTVETADFIINIISLGGGLLRIVTTDKATGQSTIFDVTQ